MSWRDGQLKLEPTSAEMGIPYGITSVLRCFVPLIHEQDHLSPLADLRSRLSVQCPVLASAAVIRACLEPCAFAGSLVFPLVSIANTDWRLISGLFFRVMFLCLLCATCALSKQARAKLQLAAPHMSACLALKRRSSDQPQSNRIRNTERGRAKVEEQGCPDKWITNSSVRQIGAIPTRKSH